MNESSRTGKCVESERGLVSIWDWEGWLGIGEDRQGVCVSCGRDKCVPRLDGSGFIIEDTLSMSELCGK